MTPYRLVSEPQVDIDIEAAFGWYENEQTGLGLEFLDELRGAYDRIVDGPFKYSQLRSKTRRALLKRFPYAVYFVVEERDHCCTCSSTHESRPRRMAATLKVTGVYRHDTIFMRSESLDIQRSEAAVDAFTAEVIRSTVVAITDEMKTNLMRTAYNMIIYEAEDFTVGLFDADGNTISIGLGLPMFIRGLSDAIKAKLRHWGKENIEPGDILLTNDPQVMGSHLNHMIFTLPVFHDGELIAFSSSMGHWQDVGGVLGAVTRDVFSEGLQMPFVKIFKARRAGSGTHSDHPHQLPLAGIRDGRFSRANRRGPHRRAAAHAFAQALRRPRHSRKASS